MERNRGYFRFQRRRAIRRKLDIRTNQWGSRLVEEIYTPSRRGQLSKGKVHCSCFSCRTKSCDEVSRSDKRKLEQTDFQMKEWGG